MTLTERWALSSRITRPLALTIGAALLGGCSLVGTSAAPEVTTWGFDDAPVGSAPAGITAAVGDWQVLEDDASAPSSRGRVLAQLAANKRKIYNVALVDDTSYADVDITVKFLAVAGRIDQGGGVVWRAKDADNYYIARYNPLEDNYRVYTVVDGRRDEIDSVDIDRSDGWHELRVTMVGDTIRCFYDGEKHLELEDTTFRDAGKIGLWTKADAQTWFDDLTACTAVADESATP